MRKKATLGKKLCPACAELHNVLQAHPKNCIREIWDHTVEETALRPTMNLTKRFQIIIIINNIV
eukprot:6441153-Amphidinium_carterae.1